MFTKSLLLFIAFSLVACSSGQSTSEQEKQDAMELGDENQFSTEDGVNEEQYSSDTIEELPEEQALEEQANDEVAQQVNINSKDTITYTVKTGDTLMLIAFKLYGNYNRWREIKNLNPDASFTNLKKDQRLAVNKPQQGFTWPPNGDSYLIKKHDTLQTISSDIYSSTKRWHHLYQHNKQLIKNPDLIFSGFTIYYLPEEQLNRLPASK
ncbi:MAG: LysM peptidoglycan-binding domain-containing protein [Halobacteriovoraceae bacterium]|jgi:nucleoid-associated protein YgaU|nr:LysM peptidoglycan-binding domain-containing protein [Halobacteriovoraceae bacterium]